MTYSEMLDSLAKELVEQYHVDFEEVREALINDCFNNVKDACEHWYNTQYKAQ